jgi:hypothetical protein
MTDHLDDATWERLAMDELAADERARLLVHIAACPSCSKLWIALRHLEAEAAAIDPAVRRTATGIAEDTDELAARRPRKITRILIATSGLVAAAALALWLWPRPGPDALEPVEVVRGSASGSLVVEVASGVLRWRPVAGATGYRVSIFDGEGRRIWGPTELAGTTQAIPRVTTGGQRARIEALRDSTSIASALVELVVAP